MVEYVNIEDIKPAPYNPRKISQKQIETLKDSINKVGFVIPILINRKNGVIIAGHQRTKTAKLCGLKKVPAFYVNDIVLGDEIKFNQMHNAIDLSKDAFPKLLKHYQIEKFIQIDNKDFENKKVMATSAKEICKLIIKYGNVLSCVICRDTVVYGCEYVKACQLLGLKVNSYICDDSKYDNLIYFLNQQYGKFSYDGIKRDTFVQGLAQMNRLPKNGKEKKSRLYETMVLPYMKDREKGTTILDFGCGRGEYINLLKGKYNAVGVEFYNNNHTGINISKGQRMIDDLIKYFETRKNFDVVVCDSVLNSVDSIEAESAVMSFLNLMATDRLFISGRSKNHIEKVMEITKDFNTEKNWMYYLDADGFTANYRAGHWFFQHFHTKEDVYELMNKYGFNIVKFCDGGSSYQCECKKVKNLSKEQYIKAIDFEFNLPLPNGKRYGRNEEVKRALGLGDSK
jgi:ParB family chromosome partitioning protein